MKESHSEDVANHTDPESCGAVGNDGLEALTGESAGWVLNSERGAYISGADAILECGRQNPDHRYSEEVRDPAESETPRMHGHSTRATREALCPSLKSQQGPPGESDRSKAGMNGHRESDDLIMCARQRIVQEG